MNCYTVQSSVSVVAAPLTQNPHKYTHLLQPPTDWSAKVCDRFNWTDKRAIFAFMSHWHHSWMIMIMIYYHTATAKVSRADLIMI